jgi:hypothetical protein
MIILILIEKITSGGLVVQELMFNNLGVGNEQIITDTVAISRW